MAFSSILGFPRIGGKRELKKALESFWKGELSEELLLESAKSLRLNNWEIQQKAGLDFIPSNDFSFYDQLLDTCVTFGALPARFFDTDPASSLADYFFLARGRQGNKQLKNTPAMEMTKWFDTNYHYLVPEFSASQSFSLESNNKPVREFLEAKEHGILTRPVLIGPITFLLLGKMKEGKEQLALLDRLLPLYKELLSQLENAGAQWVQIDEPILACNLSEETKSTIKRTYSSLGNQPSSLKLLLASYFGPLIDNLELALQLPLDGFHIDATRCQGELPKILEHFPKHALLSLGIIDGRNIWRTDLEHSLSVLQNAANRIGQERLCVSTSCSLLHVPVDLDLETTLDPDLKSWLSFAKQKISEVVILQKALNGQSDEVSDLIHKSAQAVAARHSSKRINKPEVKQRMLDLTPEMFTRSQCFSERIQQQKAKLNLPPLPTTTIGSFPQTTGIRKTRADYRAKRISHKMYVEQIKHEIAKIVSFQEEIGLDVLVHGEAERNDMVEYFGEQLDGFAFTKFGWVQSYGSRCVKPPILFGDIVRSKPMTVDWACYAASLSNKPMKGMLTGPVTILEWSFVRDDQPRHETCFQIALAIRDEVLDLEAAGIPIIQVDEAAFREGLPLRKEQWSDYLSWAVDAFRLVTAGVASETQIHTHMCYSEFNDILEHIARMDADVITIENSRSHLELLEAFSEYKYPNEIGPGVYDIHSPIIPTNEEILRLLKRSLNVFNSKQLWVNPDCGLKTRRWEEIEPALKTMVAAAKEMRKALDTEQT